MTAYSWLELLHGTTNLVVGVVHPAEDTVQQGGKKPCLGMHANKKENRDILSSQLNSGLIRA